LTGLAIIGAGSWGTALAIVLAPRFERTYLWARRPELASVLQHRRTNEEYLPGCLLPENIEVTASFHNALIEAELVINVVPSLYVRKTFACMAPHLKAWHRVVNATKGIENGTLLRMSEVIGNVLRGTPADSPVAVLSGPTFAREVAQGKPAAVVVSSTDARLASQIQEALSGPALRLYTNADPIGVEIGAAMKNVIAIAAGICQGMDLGSNVLAALITRGLAESTRLALAMGGRSGTLAGLAGLGDLVLTCHGELSRNRAVGLELARGKALPEILASTRMVAEGVETTLAAVDLGKKWGVELPIAEQMHAVLFLGKPPRDGVRDLMDRSLKGE